MEKFNRLFSKEKSIPAMMQTQLYEDFVCTPRQENVAVNAAAYIRFSSARNAERFLDYEKEKAIQYCEFQEYNLLSLIISAGSDAAIDSSMDKIMELAEKGMVDVVVIPTVEGLSRNPQDMIRLIDKLYGCGVKIECIGYGDLEQKILSAYIEENIKLEKKFDEILRSLVCGERNIERSR